MHPRNVTAFIIGIVMAILVAAAGIVIWRLPEITKSMRMASWKSDPKAKRAHAPKELSETVCPGIANGDPWDPKFLRTWGEVTLEDESLGSGQRLKVQCREPSAEYAAAYEMVHLQAPDFRAPLGPGSVRLAVLGARYATDGQEALASRNYFNPSGGTIDPALAKLYDLSSEENQPPHRPGLDISVVIAGESLGRSRWRARGFYDHDTHSALANGYSWNDKSDGIYMATVLSVFHDAAISAMASVAFGDPILRTIPWEVGEFAGGPDFPPTLRVLYLGRGDDRRYSTNHGWQTIEIFIPKLEEVNPAADHYAWLMVEPRAFAAQVEIVAVSSSGKRVLGSAFFGNQPDRVSFAMGKEEIAHLEIAYLPRLARIRADLPDTRLVAPENLGITNLFQCRIPEASFKNEEDLLEWIGQITQLQVRRSTSTALSPEQLARHFPMQFNNTTPAEMLERYRDLFPKCEIRIDSAKQALVIEERKPFDLVDWLRGKVPKGWLGP